MFPSVGLFLLSPSRLPHAGGGVSVRAGMPLIFGMSSPRRWGCFLIGLGYVLGGEVFPTQVGVFLHKRTSTRSQRCLPHAGGGVSQLSYTSRLKQESSPRRWGCFVVVNQRYAHVGVFPTQVGVFLPSPSSRLRSGSLPHAGGGVSGY